MHPLTICHRNGTVSFWSISLEQYMEGQTVISTAELTAMDINDRKRVMDHLKRHAWGLDSTEKVWVRKGA
jgi:hypothetical protein